MIDLERYNPWGISKVYYWRNPAALFLQLE